MVEINILPTQEVVRRPRGDMLFFLLSESKKKNKQKENTVPVQSIRIPLSLHSVTRSTLIVITVGINVTLSVFTWC